MSLISYAKNGNIKRFNEELKSVSKKESKSAISLKIKFIKCFLMIGSGYSDYLNYELYKKSNDEIKEYVSIKDQDKFYEIVSPSLYKKFFTIKPDFLKNFKNFCKRDFFSDGSIKELESFLKKHEVFMLKPYDGLGGSGVVKMHKSDVKDILAFYEKLKSERLFLEEYVVQNKAVSEICKESLNTIRIMTFNYGDTSEILFACMRFGNGEASVDNFHQGGMGVLIDIESGKLVGDAVNKNLEHFKEHPKSHKKFDGFKVPHWEQIKKIVLSASKVNKNIHVVGWDIGITEDGATIIEGNRRPGFDLPQVLSKRGRKDIMKHCLDIINKKEGTNYKI